ncbi:MAG: dihydrolipoyl dehydrogenase [Alphaproteobacteria bacterium]|nr:dihydrolipoyl dehydrogenase [Alphaproteobacteria bacterium]
MSDTYDLVVVGGGPGGYVCAIRAAQLGLKTACVEKRGALGGTCLNVGCIPSKALLNASEKFEEANHAFAALGIKAGNVELDLDGMLKHKDKVVADLTKGVEFLFKKNKVDYVKGAGRITAPGEVAVDDGKVLKTKNIVIATGSDVMPLPGVEIDENKVVSSTGALSLSPVPGHLIVVGGGYIGLELGSVWRRLGAKVTVVEFLDRIVPGMDGEIGKNFQRILKRQGIVFRLGTKVTAAKVTDAGVALTVEPAAGGDAEELTGDAVLVSIGRRPHTEGLGLADVGVETDQRGFVVIDDHFKTNVDGIYAIGDVVRGPMLAHKAEEEGVAVSEMLAGGAGHVNYETVPGIVYTWPEVAAVGKTEEQLKEAGVAYKVGKFPFMANSRARCNMQSDGMVKILADAKTDRVLGAHIIGPEAGDMIHEVVVLMEFGGSAEDLARSFHGHPTYNEAVKEAALDVAKRAIHM